MYIFEKREYWAVDEKNKKRKRKFVFSFDQLFKKTIYATRKFFLKPNITGK